MIVRSGLSRSWPELTYRIRKQWYDEYAGLPTAYPRLFAPWWLAGYKPPWWERFFSWRH